MTEMLITRLKVAGWDMIYVDSWSGSQLAHGQTIPSTENPIVKDNGTTSHGGMEGDIVIKKNTSKICISGQIFGEIVLHLMLSLCTSGL